MRPLILFVSAVVSTCLLPAQTGGGNVTSNTGLPQPASATAARPSATGDAPKAAPASVEGKVTNAITGAPLRKVSVTIMPSEPGQDRVMLSATTDENGRYRLADVPPGRYQLMGTRTGFVRQNWSAQNAFSPGAVLPLGPGQEMKQIDLKLQPHAVITGRVTDEDGEPASNVSIQALAPRYFSGKREMMPAGSGYSNDLGEYRIFGLAPGRYYISAVAGNRSGMSGAVVNASSSGGQSLTGYATMYYPGVPDIASATAVAVTAGTPISGVDFRLHPSRVARLKGTVRNVPKGGAMRVMVMLSTRSGFGNFMNSNTTVNAQGKFELSGVVPGSYYVIAQSFENEFRTVAKVPVDVGSSDIENIDLELQTGEDLSGTIRLETATGVSPSDIRLFVQPTEMSPFGGGGAARIKDDGSFTIPRIVADNYRVVLFPSPTTRLYIKSVQAGEQVAKDHEFKVSPGTAPVLTVVLAAAEGQVSGVVKDDKDTAVSGATAVLIPDAPHRGRKDLYRNVSTDQSGSYSFVGVPPGSYKLFSWDKVEIGQWQDPDFLGSFENTGKAVKVTESSKETINMTVTKNDNPG